MRPLDQPGMASPEPKSMTADAAADVLMARMMSSAKINQGKESFKV
jgi:hypothetical protein